MDLGLWLQKSLNVVRDPHANYDLILFSEQDLDPEGKKNENIRIYNSFGSSPNSPYLRICLDIIKNRFTSNLKKFTDDPVWGTGPDITSSALHYIDPSYTLNPEPSLYRGPLVNKKIFEHNEAKKIFTHHGLGSWREKKNSVETFQNIMRNKPWTLCIFLFIGVMAVIGITILLLVLRFGQMKKSWILFLVFVILIMLGITIFLIIYTSKVGSKTRQNRETFTDKELSLCPKLLENTVEFVESLSIPYWLTAGTLLGTIREGNIIKNDKDMDIAIPKKYSAALRAAIKKDNHEKFGLECTRVWKNLVSFVLKNKTKKVFIDIYDYIDIEINDMLTQARLMNRLYYIPKNSEKLLECMYGNWKIPSGKHASFEDMESCLKKQKISNKKKLNC